MDTLTAFPGSFKYKPGVQNIADPLSRMPAFYVGVLTRSRKANALKANQQPLYEEVDQSSEGEQSTSPESHQTSGNQQPESIPDSHTPLQADTHP